MEVTVDLSELSTATKVRLAEDVSKPEVLAELAKDSEACVRLSVAANPANWTDTLDVLADDQHWFVATAVAKNPTTLSETLEDLAHHINNLVRESARKALEKREN